MRQAGAHTLAQDEESCVVFGMPKEAIKLGAADEVVPLSAMTDHILDAVQRSVQAVG
jgi:two-component system chemotaxis response regulator CheB